MATNYRKAKYYAGVTDARRRKVALLGKSLNTSPAAEKPKPLPRLMTRFSHEPTEEEVHRLTHRCVFCKKELMLLCGSPKVVWGGCCVGYTTPTKRVMTSRVAHVPCFLNWLRIKRLVR